MRTDAAARTAPRAPWHRSLEDIMPMRAIAATTLIVASLATAGRPSFADPAPARTISVSATGTVQYSPDIARVALGVRAEAASASAAANSVNGRARSVVEAARKLGIADRDIKTSGYSIQYQPPQPPQGGVEGVGSVLQPGQVSTQSIARKPLPGTGTYVADETIIVTSPIDKAGVVLDAAIAAGANETYGLTFDTTARDALYKQALAKAVASARAQAQIAAQAAGVSIAGLQSMDLGGGGEPVPMMRAAVMENAYASAPAPVMGGTDTIQTTVQVVFRIR